MSQSVCGPSVPTLLKPASDQSSVNHLRITIKNIARQSPNVTHLFIQCGMVAFPITISGKRVPDYKIGDLLIAEYPKGNNPLNTEFSAIYPAHLQPREKAMIEMTPTASVAARQPIAIQNVSIRQDDEGRYSLNDLHRASGSEERHSPNRWTRTEAYQALVSELTPELAFAPSVSIRGGSNPGTYVCKELVYAYAMWISPKFHLIVIRTYDQVRTQPADPLAALNDPATMRGLLLNYSEKVIELEKTIQNQKPKVEALDRLSSASGSITLRETATTLRCGERKMISWMQQNNWLYRRPGRGTLLGYAERIKSGHLTHKVIVIHNERTGEDETRESVRVTPAGLALLAQRLKNSGLLIEVTSEMDSSKGRILN